MTLTQLLGKQPSTLLEELNLRKVSSPILLAYAQGWKTGGAILRLKMEKKLRLEGVVYTDKTYR